MERSYITRDQLIALAVLIKTAVESGEDTISHGQVSIADARRALVMGLWRCRQKQQQDNRSRVLPVRRHPIEKR